MYPLLLEIAGVRLHSYGVAVAAAAEVGQRPQQPAVRRQLRLREELRLTEGADVVHHAVHGAASGLPGARHTGSAYARPSYAIDLGGIKNPGTYTYRAV